MSLPLRAPAPTKTLSAPTVVSCRAAFSLIALFSSWGLLAWAMAIPDRITSRVSDPNDIICHLFGLKTLLITLCHSCSSRHTLLASIFSCLGLCLLARRPSVRHCIRKRSSLSIICVAESTIKESLSAPASADTLPRNRRRPSLNDLPRLHVHHSREVSVHVIEVSTFFLVSSPLSLAWTPSSLHPVTLGGWRWAPLYLLPRASAQGWASTTAIGRRSSSPVLTLPLLLTSAPTPAPTPLPPSRASAPARGALPLLPQFQLSILCCSCSIL